MAKKSNWEKLQAQDAKSTVRNRDVYEDQQLDRSKIQEKQSPMSRIIFSAVIAVLASLLVYFVVSFVQFGVGHIQSTVSSVSDQVDIQSNTTAEKKQAYYKKGMYKPTGSALLTDREFYWLLDENGEVIRDKYYENAEDVPIPDWYKVKYPDATNPVEKVEAEKTDGPKLGDAMAPNWWKILASLVVGGLIFIGLYTIMMRNLDAQNLMADTSDINQYPNDQHIALPEEVQRNYDWFPDVGAHSDVQPSSMISHMALSNKGLKSVKVAKRAKKDILDEDGNVLYYKGEMLRDDNDDPIFETKPIIDEKFMDALFEASGALDDKKVRMYYDTTKIPYNRGNKNREKLKGYDTVADLINGDWEFPAYEPQRPGGGYIVDTAPVNTMVLAITRAGKGQTVIEKQSDSVYLTEINAHTFYC